MTLPVLSNDVGRWFIVVLAVVAGWLHPASIQAASAEFTDPNHPEVPLTHRLVKTEEGKALLTWRATEETSGSELVFELQYAPAPAATQWVTRYKGPDLASFVSGLSEGRHAYRVRVAEPEGVWSERVTVQVVYPDRAMVISLLSLGLVVLIATVTAIWRGHAHRPEAPTQSASSG